MTKTNFSAKADAIVPRQRNIHRKQAPAGFAEILDQRTAPETKAKPEPSATIKPKPKRRDATAGAEFGQGPTGTVITDMQLRPPKRDDQESILERMRKQTLPYARTQGTFVRVPTFSDLGSDAVEAEPEPEAISIRAEQRGYSDDPWLPPAPSWGQSRGPDPELVQTPPEEELMAMAMALEMDDEDGEMPLIQELGWEALEPDAEPMIDLEAAFGAFEMALTVQDDASPLDEDAANFAPIPDFDTPIDHKPSFLSAMPTVVQEASPTYGSDGNVFTTADPQGPVARNVEVFRTSLNRAAITVDTDDGQIELAITTAGKHVMIEATAAGGFTDSIQRDLDALRNALERHDLELTELSFGEPRGDTDGSRHSRESHQSQPPTVVPAPEHGERDLGFTDDGRQTWVVPTGFRVVA